MEIGSLAPLLFVGGPTKCTRLPAAAGEAESAGLSAEQARAVRERLWALLSRRALRYTTDDSSSLPVETAEALWASICFAIGVRLRETQSSPALLLSREPEELLREGTETLKRELAETKSLWLAVCREAPLKESISMNDTLREIGVFFSRCDVLFRAHEILCSIDYQLCLPVPDTLLGVEYVAEYLRRLAAENAFFNGFGRRLTAALLNRASPGHRELLVNLYEPVLQNAVGRALLGLDPRPLTVPEEALPALAALFDGKNPGELKALLRAAVSAMGTADGAAAAYLELTAEELAPRIPPAIAGGGLGNIFVCLPEETAW